VERTISLGVISDTHGLVRPEAVRALEGVDLIVHAGDIGGPDVLEALRAIAPVHAVRGNNDHGDWAWPLPGALTVPVGEASVFVLHDIAELDFDPAAAGVDAVVTGHSHRPLIERKNGVLFLNPGSAGPRRFTLPIALATVEVRGRSLNPHIVDLAV